MEAEEDDKYVYAVYFHLDYATSLDLCKTDILDGLFDSEEKAEQYIKKTYAGVSYDERFECWNLSTKGTGFSKENYLWIKRFVLNQGII